MKLCRSPRLAQTVIAIGAMIFVAGFFLLLLTGCSSATGTHVWWNPTTWGPDRAATAAKIGAKQDANSGKLNVEAMREVFKTGEALAAAPAENRAVAVARRTNANAYSLLGMANGALDLGAIQADRETIAQLLSENADLRATGEANQAKAEGNQAKLSAENAQLRADKAASDQKLAEGYERERKLANTTRNFWFIVIGLGVLYVAGNVLRIAAPFVPALGGVSKVVSGVVNPAAEYALHRAQAGLQKVGHGMAALRDKLPELVAQVKDLPNAAEVLEERLTGIFDAHTDTDTQKAIAAAANTAPRS